MAVVMQSGWAAQPAGLRLNEFQASSVTVHPDNADFDDYSDWIELHNPTGAAVDLYGYFLTDNPDRPMKWAFPPGTVLASGGHLVVRADGFHAVPGEQYQRESSPWRVFTALRLHTNFKLAQEGESIGLHRFDGTIEELDLVATGSSWRYLDTGTSPGGDWTNRDFGDAHWLAGKGQLGYGDGDEATVIGYGDDSENRYPAYYFRHKFMVDDPTTLSQIRLRLLADDGAIVYLNGVEVFRPRMPAGAVNHLTFSQATAPENFFDLAHLEPSQLVAGENILAVEVHQTGRRSSDVSFDLQLSARRLTGSPVLVDSVTYGPQYPDASFGRDPANDGEWTHFGEPTPGEANVTFPAIPPAIVAAVEFSSVGGHYPEPLEVSLSSPDGGEIRFTLDGSKPDLNSPVYTAPVSVNATTVVRARAFQAGKLPGPVATHTYFLNEPASVLPTISFVVEPDKFFDATLGIYTNVYKERETPVHLEFFEADRTPGFRVNAGARIAGENIWRFAQKPLTVNLRGKYGSDRIDYKLFPNQRVGSFGRLVLRNGGDNWPNAMLRDATTPFLLSGQSESDVQSYRPSVLYMNGRYWGIHNIREKLDDQYFMTHHRINTGTYDYLEYGHVIGNELALLSAEGTPDAYLELESFATNNLLSLPENFAHVEALVDVDNFIDYVCVQDFVYNSSWSHNREFWRERRDGAKWRWVVADLDRGFNTNNISLSLLDNFIAGYPLFAAMSENEEFKHRLLQRYAAHISSTFHPDRIHEIVGQLADEVAPEVDRHVARWQADGGMTLTKRAGELEEIKSFASRRAPYIFEDIANILGAAETVNLTVNVQPPDAGVVRLQGVPFLPGYTNTARMFRDVPLEMSAEAAPGFVFAGWSDDLGAATEVVATFTANRTVTANFVASPETLIPPVVTGDLELTAAGSPYTSDGSILVESGASLTIGPGVIVRLPESADVVVRGHLSINGTENDPVWIEPRVASKPWGAIAFMEADGESRLSHVVLRGGSLGADPLKQPAAISNHRSALVIEHADIESAATIFARGGSTVLRSSRVHSPFSGDGINIKDGAGLVEDCVFIGNDAPDTDAIDFDGVVDGVIRRNRILAFRGPNSDGIDVGEGCVNLLVSGNLIYHSSDKGISVGQGSEVRIERNLIVGCALGVAVKDTGSSAMIDQNTFANNHVDVAAFEKNLGAGGGTAVVGNSIFFRSKDAPVMADAHSTVAVTYSLSDTVLLPGAGNFVADPLFTDARAYDFSLPPESPAVDAGDPSHALDSDGTRADLGAYYAYAPTDYPYHPPNVVVINEVLAHSHDAAPDWVELFNAGNEPVDVGGWYLSDSAGDLMKYRIADGTTIPGRGFLVLSENENFGAASTDAGRLTPFALSENGETVYLFAPGDGLYLDYLETESMGASATGISHGRHFKAGSGTFNFVAMSAPTPGAPNSLPVVGPVVISEIMYHPAANADAEYVELANISSEPVTLHDAVENESWRIVSGVDLTFPADPAVVMQPGERILLVRNYFVFLGTYGAPEGTQILPWTAGALNNGGERLELALPGDVDELLERRFIRVDRVNYDDAGLWPAAADGAGASLTRVNLFAYGNDPANWIAAAPTPGTAHSPRETSAYSAWVVDNGLPIHLSAAGLDADLDGRPNLLEYVLGSRPDVADPMSSLPVTKSGDALEVAIALAAGLNDVVVTLQQSSELAPADWELVPGASIEPHGNIQVLRATVPTFSPRQFFRLMVRQN